MGMGGDLDYFVAGAGTGGTITGISKFLKERSPGVVNVLVEPTESRVLVGSEATPHKIMGIGAGGSIPFVEDLAPGMPLREGPRGCIDEFASASTEEAVAMANR